MVDSVGREPRFGLRAAPVGETEPVDRPVDQFVGRGEELDRLVAWATASSEARLVVVEGEAGAGKTRLVTEAVARLPGTVTWSTGWDGDAGPAYWSWVPVLRTCLAAVDGDDWRDRNPVAAADVQALLPESARRRHG